MFVMLPGPRCTEGTFTHDIRDQRLKKPTGSKFRSDRMIFGKNMNFLLITKMDTLFRMHIPVQQCDFPQTNHKVSWWVTEANAINVISTRLSEENFAGFSSSIFPYERNSSAYILLRLCFLLKLQYLTYFSRKKMLVSPVLNFYNILQNGYHRIFIFTSNTSTVKLH